MYNCLYSGFDGKGILRSFRTGLTETIQKRHSTWQKKPNKKKPNNSWSEFCRCVAETTKTLSRKKMKKTKKIIIKNKSINKHLRVHLDEDEKLVEFRKKMFYLCSNTSIHDLCPLSAAACNAVEPHFTRVLTSLPA